MALLKKIIMFALILTTVFLTFSMGEVELTRGVSESIATSVREYVARNNLIKTGLLFEEFKRGRVVGIYLTKNDSPVVGEYKEDLIFTRKIVNVIYSDNEGKVELAKVVLCIDTMPAFVSSLFLSIILFIVFNIYFERLKIRDEVLISDKLEKEKIFELKKQAQEFVHDIKSPLTSLELSLSELKKSSRYEKEMATLDRSLIRIKEIGSRFIENQEINQEWVELIVLGESLKDLVIEKEAELSIKIKLVIDDNAKNSKVLATRDLFKRMISNLINNSMESIQSAGKEADIKLSVKTQNEKVIIELEDNGFGFSEAVLLNNKFDRFSTKANGMGIGLSTAHSNLVKWAGGLEIKNKNTGALVTMWLKNHENYQIVLIDDDELNRIVWASEAEKIKMKFASFEDLCQKAMDRINENNSLVYLDSNLKNDKKGEDLIDSIKSKATVDVRFFIETGNRRSLYKHLPNVSGVSGKKPNWLT